MGSVVAANSATNQTYLIKRNPDKISRLERIALGCG